MRMFVQQVIQKVCEIVQTTPGSQWLLEAERVVSGALGSVNASTVPLYSTFQTGLKVLCKSG